MSNNNKNHDEDEDEKEKDEDKKKNIGSPITSPYWFAKVKRRTPSTTTSTTSDDKDDEDEDTIISDSILETKKETQSASSSSDETIKSNHEISISEPNEIPTTAATAAAAVENDDVVEESTSLISETVDEDSTTTSRIRSNNNQDSTPANGDGGTNDDAADATIKGEKKNTIATGEVGENPTTANERTEEAMDTAAVQSMIEEEEEEEPPSTIIPDCSDHDAYTISTNNKKDADRLSKPKAQTNDDSTTSTIMEEEDSSVPEENASTTKPKATSAGIAGKDNPKAKEESSDRATSTSTTATGMGAKSLAEEDTLSKPTARDDSTTVMEDHVSELSTNPQSSAAAGKDDPKAEEASLDRTTEMNEVKRKDPAQEMDAALSTTSNKTENPSIPQTTTTATTRIATTTTTTIHEQEDDESDNEVPPIICEPEVADDNDGGDGYVSIVFPFRIDTNIGMEELQSRERDRPMFTSGVRADIYNVLRYPQNPTQGIPASAAASNGTTERRRNSNSMFQAILLVQKHHHSPSSKTSSEELSGFDTYAFCDRALYETMMEQKQQQRGHAQLKQYTVLSDDDMIQALSLIGDTSPRGLAITKAFEAYLSQTAWTWGDKEAAGFCVEFLIAFGNELSTRLDVNHRIRSKKLTEEEVAILSKQPFCNYVQPDAMRIFQNKWIQE
eukprot:scaffold4004_cov105-Cylindrotheca_fusiformis.AAC.9